MPLSSATALQRFVDRLTTRSILSDEEQAAIMTLPTHGVDLVKKQDFVHINEVAHHACLVASGVVCRFGQTANGARQITAFHIPGDMADLNSIVRPVGIGGMAALSDARIFRIPHSAIRALAAQYPAIAEAFWRDCLLDAAVLMQWVVNVGRRDARTRLAHILCEMAIRSGQDRAVLTEYDLPVTQEQLGDAAGLTSVHVNRSLKTLQGVVNVVRGRVNIVDWAALADIGEFNAAYLVADTGADRPKRLLSNA